MGCAEHEANTKNGKLSGPFCVYLSSDLLYHIWSKPPCDYKDEPKLEELGISLSSFQIGISKLEETLEIVYYMAQQTVPWAKSPSTFIFINKVWLVHSLIDLFVHCLWLLSRYRDCGLERPEYLLTGPLWEELVPTTRRSGVRGSSSFRYGCIRGFPIWSELCLSLFFRQLLLVCWTIMATGIPRPSSP